MPRRRLKLHIYNIVLCKRNSSGFGYISIRKNCPSTDISYTAGLLDDVTSPRSRCSLFRRRCFDVLLEFRSSACNRVTYVDWYHLTDQGAFDNVSFAAVGDLRLRYE